MTMTMLCIDLLKFCIAQYALSVGWARRSIFRIGCVHWDSAIKVQHFVNSIKKNHNEFHTHAFNQHVDPYMFETHECSLITYRVYFHILVISRLAWNSLKCYFYRLIMIFRLKIIRRKTTKTKLSSWYRYAKLNTLIGAHSWGCVNWVCPFCVLFFTDFDDKSLDGDDQYQLQIVEIFIEKTLHVYIKCHFECIFNSK